MRFGYLSLNTEEAVVDAAGTHLWWREPKSRCEIPAAK